MGKPYVCIIGKRGHNVGFNRCEKKANEKYIQNNYKQVKLSMPKAEAETLDEYCKAKNLTKAGFIRQAIKEKNGKRTIKTTHQQSTSKKTLELYAKQYT